MRALLLGIALSTCVSACGDWLRTPCGCPIGTICRYVEINLGAWNKPFTLRNHNEGAQ